MVTDQRAAAQAEYFAADVPFVPDGGYNQVRSSCLMSYRIPVRHAGKQPEFSRIKT